MQKIVINRCYGGYSLSNFALLKLYEQGSDSVEADDPKEYYGGRTGWEEKFEEDKVNDWRCLTIAPNGKIITEERNDETRSDHVLIELIEKYGDKMNGDHAELGIVEIPDGIEWEIEEYNGMEWVSEQHRTWR